MTSPEESRGGHRGRRPCGLRATGSTTSWEEAQSRRCFRASGRSQLPQPDLDSRPLASMTVREQFPAVLATPSFWQFVAAGPGIQYTLVQGVSSCSVTKSCLRPPGPQHARLPCPYFPEFAQTHVHRVGDAIQPSHPLLPLLLLPSIFPSTEVFSSESALAFLP